MRKSYNCKRVHARAGMRALHKQLESQIKLKLMLSAWPERTQFKDQSHLLVCGMKQCNGNNTRRKQQEMRLIFELGTLRPSGLNINFNFI